MEEFFVLLILAAAGYGIYCLIKYIQENRENSKRLHAEHEKNQKLAEEEKRAEQERLETIKAAMRQIIEDKGIPDSPEDKIEQAAKDFCNYIVFVPKEQELALTKVAYKRYRPEYKGEWIFTTTEEEFCQYIEIVLFYYYGDFPETIKELIEEENMDIAYYQIDWDIAKPKLFNILKKIFHPDSPDDIKICDKDIKQAILSSLKQEVTTAKTITSNKSDSIIEVLLDICRKIIENVENNSPTISCKNDVIALIKERYENYKSLNELKPEDHVKFCHFSLVNASADLLASGQFHIWRGELDPLTCSSNLLKLHKHCLDWLLENEYITKEAHSANIEQLFEDIKTIG